MPPQSSTPASARRDANVLNAEIRDLCAGRQVWSREALAELAWLRAEWRRAVEAEERAA